MSLRLEIGSPGHIVSFTESELASRYVVKTYKDYGFDNGDDRYVVVCMKSKEWLAKMIPTLEAANCIKAIYEQEPPHETI